MNRLFRPFSISSNHMSAGSPRLKATYLVYYVADGPEESLSLEKCGVLGFGCRRPQRDSRGFAV